MLDVAIIGGGHNGLTAAAYLARAGLRCTVFERRPLLGGACVTEELWPGFRCSRAAYVAGLLRPKVVEELGLRARGLRLLLRTPSSFTPQLEGPGLLLGRDAASNAREIGRFSKRDAERYPAYEDFLDRVAFALEPMLDAPPPELPRLRARDLPPLLRVGLRALRLGRQLPHALALLLGAARPILETWFESEPLRSTLATDAVIGAWAAPSTPGTGYVLFHHVMGETGGARGVWAYVEGGMGGITHALSRAAQDAGAELRCEAPVASVAIERGRATGLELASGEEIGARCVASCADPLTTFFDLLGREHLPEEFARAIAALDFRSPSMKINLALECLPRFRGRSTEGLEPGPEHRGTIHMGAETLDEIESSFIEAQAGQLPRRPLVELTLPTSLDDNLAPPGCHVGSLFVQHVPYELASGSWEHQREAFADHVFSLIEEVAPGFRQSVLHREVLAPPDIERIFGLRGGNIFQGAMTLDRLLFMRPVPGWSRYRTPIPGLYLCGAAAHPGGGIMGACGRNAALEIARDLRA